MKVVFGLGNPGEKYANTRHNAGFFFVDKLREFMGWDKFWDVGQWQLDKYLNSEVCTARSESENKLVLVKPVTFMNKSGIAAKQIVARYGISLKDEFVLVHDDLDIELGSYKIHTGVSPKQHNGVRSVENMLGSSNFLRVRIGIDSRSGDRTIPSDDYVLMKMSDSEVEILEEAVIAAVKSLRNVYEF
ncbi:aminoacyl-tRNA hydrolase [Candidatus Dojkabacteria bacterium]|nr:aminoacyl-tRNA hydrolase [Candidatus Dojkabacteria bacterium]